MTICIHVELILERSFLPNHLRIILRWDAYVNDLQNNLGEVSPKIKLKSI